MDYDGNLNEIFEDVIGVSIYENEPVNIIYFWVSDFSADYVLTKPLHESQRTLNKKTEEEFRQQYPSLQGGRFFRIDCKRNYELIRDLTSYGKELLVLEPSNIREEIEARIKSMGEDYEKLRTKLS